MEVLTFKEFKEGKKGYFSDREALNDEGLNDNDRVVNFAYTDYGGDFFDNIAIQYIIQECKNFVVESTVYYGKNLVLYGIEAVEFIEAFEQYPLGFRDIESFYYQCESDYKSEGVRELVNEYKRYDEVSGESFELNDDEKNEVVYELLNNQSELFDVLQSGSLDYNSDKVELAIESFLDGQYKVILSEKREKAVNSQYFNIIE